MSSLSQMAQNNNTGADIKNFVALIEMKKSYIIETLQSEVKFNKFKSNLIRLYNDTNLKSCTPLSVLGAAMQVANLQLDLDPTLGQAYVLARWDSKTRSNVASFQIGYQGLLELARRSGEIKRIETHIIWENEQYEYFFDDEKGTVIRHFPLPPSKRGESRVAAYFVGYLTNGAIHKEWMWGEEIEYLKEDSLSKIKPEYQKYSPWKASVISEDAMWKKSTIRRGVKYLPKTSEIETVFAFEDEEAKGNLVDYTKVVEGELPKIVTDELPNVTPIKKADIDLKPIYTPVQQPAQRPVQQPQQEVKQPVQRPVQRPQQEVKQPAQRPVQQPQQEVQQPAQRPVQRPAQQPVNQNLFASFDPFEEEYSDENSDSKIF